MVSRLASQKGFDILMEPLPKLLEARDVGLFVLGSGEERYASFFESLSRRFPARVAFTSAYNEILLVGAVITLAGAACALVLIRSRDFVRAGAHPQGDAMPAGAEAVLAEH